MTGIALFALALLAALLVGSGRRHALARGWRRGPVWSPAASPRPARTATPPRAGRTPDASGPCGGSGTALPKAA